MFRIQKKVIDNVTLRKCMKKTCECFDRLVDKKTISVRDVNQYKDCYKCATYNFRNGKKDSIKVKLAPLVQLEDDRGYPPLL